MECLVIKLWRGTVFVGLLALMAFSVMVASERNASATGQQPTSGNVLVGSGSVVNEYTTQGGLVGQWALPSPAVARDIAVDVERNIHVYNGTYSPVLSTFSSAEKTWQSHTFSDWNNVFVSGTSGLATFGSYVFAPNSRAGGSEERGVVRFDSRDFSTQLFTTYYDLVDLNVGLDGRLYVMDITFAVRIYDPDTMSLVGYAEALFESSDLAVNSAADMFVAADGDVYKFNRYGVLVDSLDANLPGILDLEVTADGYVIASTGYGEMFVTDQYFDSVTSFAAPEAGFIAAVLPQGCPGSACPAPPLLPLPERAVCTQGAPGCRPEMLISSLGGALVGGQLQVTIDARLPVGTEISGFAEEVLLPQGVTWVQRANCLQEVQVTVGGAPPAWCARSADPFGDVRHVVLSALKAPPLDRLDDPIGPLIEFDLRCDQPGLQDLVLTSVSAGDPFGAVFMGRDTETIDVATISYMGRSFADVHRVLCVPPDSLLDSDNDGCLDVEEVNGDQTAGGKRNPQNFWDFFDTPEAPTNFRDGSINGSDFMRLLARFGATGSSTALAEAQMPPPPAPAYHPSYDRGTSSRQNAWSLTAADGAISGTDFFAMLIQFGHSCA